MQIHLSKLPPDLNVESVLLTADMLRRDTPPSRLPGFRRLSKYSVLKKPGDESVVAESMLKRHIEECRHPQQISTEWQIAGTLLVGIFGVAVAIYSRDILTEFIY